MRSPRMPPHPKRPTLRQFRRPAVPLAYVTRDGSEPTSSNGRMEARGRAAVGVGTGESRPKIESAATVCSPTDRMLHHRLVYTRAARRRRSGCIDATLVRPRLRSSRYWSGPQRPPSSHARTRYSICGDVAKSEYSVTRLLYVQRLIVAPSTLQAPGCGVPSACTALPMHMSHTTGRPRPRAHPRISKSDCRISTGSASKMSSLTEGVGFSRTPASLRIGRYMRSNAVPRRRSKPAARGEVVSVTI